MAEKNAHDSGFKMEPLYWVLLAVPLAVILKIAHADGLWIFLISGVAIIPLAGLMGKATEYLAETMGAGIGGLLNATFGNAAELIIALIAMWKALENPELLDLVRASITGSIVGNILLVLGLAILLGGLKQKRQTFNRTAASMGATLLAIAAAGLLLPTLYYHLPPEGGGKVTTLSEEIAVLLMVTYLLSLIFSLKTHSHLFAGPEASADQVKHEPEWSRRTSIIVLVCATIGVAWMSELLIGSVEHA